MFIGVRMLFISVMIWHEVSNAEQVLKSVAGGKVQVQLLLLWG